MRWEWRRGESERGREGGKGGKEEGKRGREMEGGREEMRSTAMHCYL